MTATIAPIPGIDSATYNPSEPVPATDCGADKQKHDALISGVHCNEVCVSTFPRFSESVD
jgi:hypothetical protein